MDPQTYRQVLERYDRAKAFGETRSLPEYATHLNDIYQTDAFGAGMRDGPWTRFSTRVDQTLGDTLGQVTGPIGEAFGGAFGHPEAGKAVGEGLPRALIQSAPLYALGPEAGLPATIAALGGTGALFGAQTYADTGSPGAAALSGVTAAALPGLGRFGGNLGARAFGGSRVAGDLAGKAYNEILPATATDAFQVQAGRFAGSQLAQVGAQLGSQVAQSHVQGGNEGFGDALTSPEFWLNQIPFTVYDAVHAAKTRVPLAGEVRAQLTPQGKVVEPLYTPPPATDVQQAQLNALLNGFTKVNADPNATGEQRAASLKAVLDNVNAPADATAQAAAVANAPTGETPFMLQGHADKIGNGNYRVRVMGHNDIENGPKIGSTVFVNGVEPDANGVFHVTPSQVKPATFELAEPKPKAGLDPAVNPDLPPVQPLTQGGELPTYESPALEGQPVELSSADVDGMRAMGVTDPQIARVQDLSNVAQGIGIAAKNLKEHIQGSQENLEGFAKDLVDKTMGTVKMGELGDLFPESGIFGEGIRKLKQSVAKYEIAKQGEAVAREKTIAVPTKAEEWAAHVDPVKGKDQITAHIDNGATPTQAVEAARLQTQTPIVDESVAEQAVQENVVHRTVSESQFGEQNKYGGAILDEVGKRRNFGSQPEALEFLIDYQNSHPEDDSTYHIRNAGRSAAGRERGFYIAPKENVKVAYDTNAEGQGLENVLGTGPKEHSDIESIEQANEGNLGKDAQEQELATTPVENRPDVSRKSVLDLLDVADRNPEAFAEFVDPDIIEDSPKNLVAKARITLQLGTDGLAKVNEALAARGIEPFKSEREMTTQMRELMKGASLFVDRYRNVSLDSMVPGDIEALPPGTLDSIQNLAAHIASQKVLGPIADIMDAVVRSDVLPKNVRMLLHGTTGHDPLGWWMHPGEEGVLDPLVNVPHYPESVNDTGWLMNAAHEIVHTTEVGLAGRDDPQANQYRTSRDQVLQAMRESKIVPQKVRSTVARLVKDDVFAKLGKNVVTPDEVREQIMKGIGKENKVYFSYVYAMLDPKELSASLFSDPKIVSIADATPMKQGLVESALTFLSKAFNRLIGNDVRNETALSTMLKAYDNYLTGGIMRKVYNGANFVRDSLVAAGVRPDALASRMQTVDRMFARGTLDASVAGFQREQANSLLPTTTAEGTLNPGLLSSLRAPEASAPYDATMNLLAGELPVHQDLLWRMQQDVKMTSDLFAAVKKGQVPGSIPPNAEANLALARAKVNSMRKAMAKQSLALARWNKLDQFDPLGWEQSISEGLTSKLRNIEPLDEIPDAAETRKLVGLERLGGGGMNWLQKNFMLTTHLKELVPATRPVISGVNDEAGLAHARAVMLNGAYVYDPKTQNLSDIIKKSNERVANSPTLMEAASDLLRWQNKEGGSQGIDLTPGSFPTKTLSRLNEADRKAVLQLITSVWQRHHVWADAVLPPALGAINRDNTGALIAARETGMLPSQARDLASQTYDALAAATSADPGQAQVGSAQLQALATKMQPDTFFAALKHAQALSEKTAAWIKRIRDNPGYTTEQRYNGDRLVMVSPSGDKFMTNGTRESLQKIQSEKAAQGYTFLDYIKEEDRANPSYGMKEDTLKALDALDVQNEQIVAELLKDQPDTAARILPRMQRAGDIRAALAASGPLPTVKRKFVEGREHLNMVDNANQFYTRMNNWVRNRATRARSGLDMMHPSVEGNTEVRNLLDQHVNNFLTPDNPLARKFVESTYFYKLGFDLGNMLLEGTQNLTTGMSGLIAESGSVTDAFGLWGKAVKDIIAHKVTGKWSDDETTALINRASDQGHLGRPSWSDIVDPDTASVTSSNGGSLFDTVRNKAQAFTARATGYNDTIGLISAYRLGREKGMSTDEAFRFAVDVKQRSLFTGGKQQRPVGLWSIKTKAVPQLLGALQTYSLGWFSQMAENYTKGFGKAPEGLTPTQRTGAKKAFMYSLMAQAALAGALGLPGVGQGLALLGQATDTDPKGWLRQNLSKLFGEDQESGGILTSLALRGVGSAGLPFDPSSRASVSIPFLGVDAYKGFDAANLGGAVTSTTSDFVKGLLGLMHGDTTAAAALLPNVAKRPYQLWQGEGDIRDSRGGLQVQLSPAERFAMAVGITPSRVQTERDTSEALKKANLAAERQQSSFVDGLATLMRQGKSSEVQQALLAYIKDHPSSNPKALVQAVASRVEAQTMPYDWRRDLNPGVQLAGLTTPRPSNELARRQLRQQTETSLGVQPSFNPAEDYRSALLDHLLDSDPLLSRPAARRAVSGKPPSATPYSWLNN